MTLAERSDRGKLLVFKLAIRFLAKLNAYRLISNICRTYIKEIRHGRFYNYYGAPQTDNKVTVLVLDYERFRGDIDLFSRHEEYRILTISWNLLRFLLSAYVYHPTEREQKSLPIGRAMRTDFALAEPGSRTFSERESYRKFLRKLIPQLFSELSIDVVMNSDFRYRREADFVRIAAELGYPHICYYREAMYTVPANYALAVERHKALSPFYGNLIAVQNNITREMFMDSGLAGESRICVRGCPRMDGYLREVEARIDDRISMERKQVAFFSCPMGAQLVDLRNFDFFSNTQKIVQALTELALEAPDLNVVIKMKDMHINQQYQPLKQLVELVSGGHQPDNLKFELGRMAAQDVILDSHVVCGMQSTTVVEAAILGRPVIVPHLRKMREAEGSEQVLMYRDNYDLFDVPDTTEHFKEIVLQRLEDGIVESDVLARRRDLFELHVSSLSGNATIKSLDCIRRVVSESRVAR